MPDRYRNLTHRSTSAFLRGWLAVVLLLALALAGCHKKKTKTPRAPQAHAAIPAPVGSIEEGLASWYGPPYHGRQAADGEIYDMEKMTAAHRTLPFQTWVRVTNRQNGLTVDVRITDRGPFVEGRIIDLSKAAARRIQLLGAGVSPVRLEVINPPSQVLASAPPSAPATAPAAPAVTPQPAPPASTSAQVQTAQPPTGAPTQPSVPLPPDTINGRDLYGVQVGAFAVYENAVRLRDQYSIEYGPAQLVIRQGAAPTWRVLVGSFDSEADAQQLAQRIRSEKQQPVFVVHLDPPPPPNVVPAPAPRPASGRKPSPMPQNPGESPR
jgi:peptidoglycan lytic transglycosylase